MNFLEEAFAVVLDKLEDRIAVLYTFVGICMLVLVVTLFNVQIINGKSYRDKSAQRVLRQETVQAPRGEMVDRNGIVLATNKLSFDVELYKVTNAKVNLNEVLLKTMRILESCGNTFKSEFPERDGVFNFTTKEKELKWKKDLNIPENATLEEVYNIFKEKYAIPKDLEEEEAKKLIRLKYSVLYQTYSIYKPAKVAVDVSEEAVAKIEESKRNLPGINITPLSKRYYPNNEVASHLIGYVSKIGDKELKEDKEEVYTQNSLVGKAGIEKSLEKELRGENGISKKEVNSFGGVTSEMPTKNITSGKNVTLTIDIRLQKVAEEALAKTIVDTREGVYKKKFADAASGAVCVLDVETGEVLAMASNPTYNPNLFVNGISQNDWDAINSNEHRPMFNRVTNGLYSPGSTYKMLVGLAAMEENVITPEEKIHATGVYPYYHKPKCWVYTYTHGRKTHGYVNMSEAIKVSCNYYFYEVGRRLGIAKLADYAKEFGLGEKTGIEIYGEANGNIAGNKKEQKDWYAGNTLSAAIGQYTNSYTPLQLAKYISILATEGKKSPVHVVQTVEKGTENKLSEEELIKLREDITGVKQEEKDLKFNKRYIETIKEGMKSVTSETGGTSYIVFKNSNLQVAGKTGTAQVTKGSDDGLFVGFAPYDKPKIAVVAVIEHGGEGHYTANVVRPIIEEYFKISEDKKIAEKEEVLSNNNISF